MSYKIIWSEDASLDLVDIISYIKMHSGKKIAKGIYTRIKRKVDNIIDFPKAGIIVPELYSIGITDIYQIIESPWKIYYKILENKILVLSVIDGRRNLEEILYKKIISTRQQN